MPNIHLFGLGGTIALDSVGGEPRRSANEILETAGCFVPQAVDRVTSFLQVPSTDIRFDDLVRLARHVRDTVPAGDVIVITQGTDTLAESAFTMDLLLGAHRTVVVTGACGRIRCWARMARAILLMPSGRPPSQLLKVLAPWSSLTEPSTPRHVNKDHAHSLSAFTSWPGPIGWVAEDRVHIAARPPAMWRSSLDHMGQVPPVALISTSLGDDGRLLSALPDLGYAGVVVEGLGGGHVPSRMALLLEALAATTPVVITKGTRCGSALSSTYAYPGSEVDLLGRGLIGSGWLTAAQARVLLGLLLAQGADLYGIRDVFSQARQW